MYRLCLKELRKKAGFKTQKEIADQLGMKERRYATLEREEVALTLEDAVAISLVLGCTPNDLCGWPKGKNAGRVFDDGFEEELIACYRASTPSRKDRILDTARDAAAMSKKWPNVVGMKPSSVMRFKGLK